jgi:hypothetical protein
MIESRPSPDLEPAQASFEQSLLAQRRLNSPPSITSRPRPAADLKNAGPEPIPVMLECMPTPNEPIVTIEVPPSKATESHARRVGVPIRRHDDRRQ